MSQFDFPKINFSGTTFINPATGNNNSWIPLVLFDYINIKAYLPPRIYVNQEIDIMLSLEIIKLPNGCSILKDKDDNKYFEITPISNAEDFKSWATTPLGSHYLDKDYHSLYQLIRTQRGNEPLTGKIPGGWNYYGGMDFEFADVAPVSIEIQDSESNKVQYSANSIDCPAMFKNILASRINFLNDKGHNTAVMIDTSPGLTFSTQVFCDNFRLYNESGILMQGKPSKATLRHTNPNRIVNQSDAIGSSGTFYCSIPMESLDENSFRFITRFFSKNGVISDEIRGVFIRYNLYEVYENLQPDYKDSNKLSNPASCKVLGSISPWYKNELQSITMGRLLIPKNPIYKNKTIGNALFKIDQKRKVILLDFVGSLPEYFNQHTQEYEIFNLGNLEFCIQQQEKETTIARIHFQSENNFRESFIHSGGILEIPYTLPEHISLDNTPLYLYAELEEPETGKRERKLLMEENEWMVAADNSGLYINQGDNPEEGYISNSHLKEPCTIAIYRYGKCIKTPVPMFIKSYIINSTLTSAKTGCYLVSNDFTSEIPLYFDTREAGNHMYILYPGTSIPDQENPIPDILQKGFLINLRILPKPDYAKYLDPFHPEYPTPISFDLIYNELLQVSDLIYPVASIITPFKESYFKKGWDYIRLRMEPKNWASYSYMPSSRDMSDELYKLICKWAEQRSS